MPWIPPELREDRGEIQAAAEKAVADGDAATVGEALFNLDLASGAYSCARCHTQGWSYGNPIVSGQGAYGWNLTGDSYLQDADGHYVYQARTDDMIISAGYNIAGPEVESALLQHPAVAECGVVGMPDEDRGRYNTLAGMVMLLLGRLPTTGDSVDWEGWRFEVVDLDGRFVLPDAMLAAIREDFDAGRADETETSAAIRAATGSGNGSSDGRSATTRGGSPMRRCSSPPSNAATSRRTGRPRPTCRTGCRAADRTDRQHARDTRAQQIAQTGSRPNPTP